MVVPKIVASPLVGQAVTALHTAAVARSKKPQSGVALAVNMAFVAGLNFIADQWVKHARDLSRREAEARELDEKNRARIAADASLRMSDIPRAMAAERTKRMGGGQ